MKEKKEKWKLRNVVLANNRKDQIEIVFKNNTLIF